VNARFVSGLRGLARRYEALGGRSAEEIGQASYAMAADVLGALGDYRRAAAFLTFCQGPLQRLFVETYGDDIRADGDRMVLRTYDDPATRKQGVAMAIQTGRLIELDSDGTHWQFREAVSPLELVQWANREGMGPTTSHLMLSELQGALAEIVVEARNRPRETEEVLTDGHYL
jgi:GNAT superfamily N-acetyltransferase